MPITDYDPLASMRFGLDMLEAEAYLFGVRKATEEGDRLAIQRLPESLEKAQKHSKGIKVKVLFDTGAVNSIINGDIAKEVCTPRSLPQGYKKPYSTAGKGGLTSRQVCDFALRLEGGDVIEHTAWLADYGPSRFLVEFHNHLFRDKIKNGEVEELVPKMIIGVDTLEKIKAAMVFRHDGKNMLYLPRKAESNYQFLTETEIELGKDDLVEAVARGYLRKEEDKEERGREVNVVFRTDASDTIMSEGFAEEACEEVLEHTVTDDKGELYRFPFFVGDDVAGETNKFCNYSVETLGRRLEGRALVSDQVDRDLIIGLPDIQRLGIRQANDGGLFFEEPRRP